ncbi:MAG: putative polymerase sigma factor 70 [Firmicutes bacterium]|nr:putative polymerase sigma factor 70 [Bacillota bacterium]
MLMFYSVIDPGSQSKHSEHKNKVVIEESIFRKIAENDLVAFEEFYHSTEKIVYTFALSILKNHEDALDVSQDTFLKIRSAAHLYRPMGKPMAWVFTITRNLAMSKLRTKTRTEGLEVEDIENNLNFSYVTDQEDKLVLQATLSILNEQERGIILLHAVSGFTHNEIAKNLGIPLSTVLSKYHRGLKKLRKHLIEQEVLS